ELADPFDWWRESASDQIETLHHTLPGMSPVYLDLVDNRKVNAWAFRAKDRYFIGVTAGLVQMVTTLFYRMLSDSRILPQVGNPTTEAERPQVVTVAPDAGWAFDGSGWEGIPNDPVRQQFAC